MSATLVGLITVGNDTDNCSDEAPGLARTEGSAPRRERQARPKVKIKGNPVICGQPCRSVQLAGRWGRTKRRPVESASGRPGSQDERNWT